MENPIIEKKKKTNFSMYTNYGEFHRNDQLTPITQLQTNIKKSNNSSSTKKTQKIILLSTGSFNPVHSMHIKMFQLCKKRIEQENENVVVGGYISPSHDHYVMSKLGYEKTIHSEYRAELIRMAIKDCGFDKWLFVDKAEMNHKNGFACHTTILKTLKKYINTMVKGEEGEEDDIRFVFVMGKDLFLRCNGHKWLQTKELGVCVLSRATTSVTNSRYYSEMEKREMKSENENLWFVESTGSEEEFKLSSSLIRKLLETNNGKEIDEKYLSKSALELMKKLYKKRKLYFTKKEHKKFYEKFRK